MLQKMKNSACVLLVVLSLGVSLLLQAKPVVAQTPGGVQTAQVCEIVDTCRGPEVRCYDIPDGGG